MGILRYTAITSLDGYIADDEGSFDWAHPDAEVHAFINDLERGVGTHLYGRRMYEIMASWETEPAIAEGSEIARDYAQIWQAADKIVYSTTLTAPFTSRTSVERRFDPDAVRQLKARSPHDLGIGGAGIAAAAFAAGLVDEVQVVVAPVVVGGGTACLPADVRLDLELVDTRRFDSGMVFLHYRAAGR